MTCFVLVHGAWHGGWCWDRMVPALRRRGHDAVVMDLPMDDSSATFATHAEVVAAACPSATDVVLVGHSLGGMVLPLVAAARPVRVQVFLCAVVPNVHGQPWDDAPPMGAEDYGYVREEDGALVFRSLAAARRIFYADCDDADARWAFERLRPLRNQSLWDRPYPLTSWPDVATAAITCADDQAVYAAYQRTVLADRLGVTPLELPGHHSPFLAQPDRLAEALTAIAAR